MRAKIISPSEEEEEEEEEEEGVEGVHAARALVLARPTPRPRIGDVPKRAGGRRASMLAWAAGGPPPWGHDRRRNRYPYLYHPARFHLYGPPGRPSSPPLDPPRNPVRTHPGRGLGGSGSEYLLVSLHEACMGGAGMGGERQVHPPSQRGSGIYGPGSIQTRVSRGGRGASVIRLRPATACLTARLWDSG
ncbi:unnamed protein product [Prorocentrum cordatum]|uniref:Uncharacterized protein n=1 Tax=Prorocentrum cordatum TaxID=2364126 RepID=A0ABN9QMU8_9DINO|nr:unnamed protein product [Polarella glacialis]